MVGAVLSKGGGVGGGEYDVRVAEWGGQYDVRVAEWGGGSMT